MDIRIPRPVLFAMLAVPLAAQAASNLNSAADDACKCMKDPYAKMEELRPVIASAMASGDHSKMMSMQGEFQQLMNNTQVCFDDLRKKYPDIDQSEELKQKVTAKMDEKCPRPDMGFGPPPS